MSWRDWFKFDLSFGSSSVPSFSFGQTAVIRHLPSRHGPELKFDHVSELHKLIKLHRQKESKMNDHKMPVFEHRKLYSGAQVEETLAQWAESLPKVTQVDGANCWANDAEEFKSGKLTHSARIFNVEKIERGVTLERLIEELREIGGGKTGLVTMRITELIDRLERARGEIVTSESLGSTRPQEQL